MNTLSSGYLPTEIVKQDPVPSPNKDSFTLAADASQFTSTSSALLQRVFDDVYGNVSFKDLSQDTLSRIEKLSVDFLRLRKIHAFIRDN